MKKKLYFPSAVILACILPLAAYAKTDQNEEVYRPVLDRYAEGQLSGWDVSDYVEHDMPDVFGYNRIEMEYAFSDVNGDGIVEMLVGTSDVTYTGDEAMYGNCFEIYTCSGGIPVRLGKGAGRYRYSVCGDGSISLYWSGGAANSGWSFYYLPDGADHLEEFLTVGSNFDEKTNSIYFFKNTAEPFSRLDGDTISQTELDQIVEAYDFLDPDFKPISDYIEGTYQQDSVTEHIEEGSLQESVTERIKESSPQENGAAAAGPVMKLVQICADSCKKWLGSFGR